MKKFIPYGRQFIDHNDIQEAIDVLESDWITQGPKITEFETSLAHYCGAKYAVVFNSGTSALHGAYFALGLQEGDEFITTPITFVATANAGVYLGAKPIFVDVEPDTGNIDVQKIENNITKKTKLISVVHYAGHPVNLKSIQHIAQKYNLKIVEDACHALGAEYKASKSGENWTKIGSCKYSDATVFSFHPVKHITTGEGGAVLTNNEEVYEKLLLFRNHGITKNEQKFIGEKHGDWYYEMHFLGYNYRMTDIQAALGLSQLKKINAFVKKRREIAQIYNNAFKDNPFFYVPKERDYARSSFHLYPIRLKEKFINKKKEFFGELRQNGLGVQVHYVPVYYHPFYQSLGYKKGLCPTAEKFYGQEISLPIFPAMEGEDVKKVIEIVFNVFTTFI
ncbi:MAG: UDP-4-amino-4,6-dideoxy-N-acetyl-beta-L-altrosamine transaminase [Desulfonauticus sp.]|nr:UDP-4-amino-4,6-dideoxy-N-acetyl-beta-L-altrosamine transaminase [Desulfonauticus sp.]